MKAKAVTIDYDPSTNEVHVNDEIKEPSALEKKAKGDVVPPVDVPPVDTPPVDVVPPVDVPPVDTPPVDVVPPVDTPPVDVPPELKYDDEGVMEYLSEKYKKDIKSLDDLTKEKEPPKQSKAVEKFLEFEKETGRGFEDFVKANRDYSSMSDDQLLMEFVMTENEGFSTSDANEELDDLFGYEEDADESVKKRKERQERSYLSKAKKYFKEQSGKYKVPLESKGTGNIPDDYVKALKFQTESLEQEVEQKELNKQIRGKFEQETDKIFSQEFKGFEIKLGDDITETYKPSDVKATKETNSNIEMFLGKFFNKDGSIKDAVGYHKALTVASDPESFAKHFYEKGRNATIEGVTGKSPQDIQRVFTGRPSTTASGIAKDFDPSKSKDTTRLNLKNY